MPTPRLRKSTTRFLLLLSLVFFFWTGSCSTLLSWIWSPAGHPHHPSNKTKSDSKQATGGDASTQRLRPQWNGGTRKPLERLNYRPDGMVEVNENGPHPIYELIARAERNWNDKVKRASRTLPDAAREYRRRYHRDPPLGFDKWWQYVIDHNVRLPDEYDSIHHDLEPFWGIEPTDLLLLQSELELKKDSFTIGKNDSTSPIQVLTWAFQEGEYEHLIGTSFGIIELLREVQDLLPPFRAVFSPHDAPNRLSDFGVKAAALEAASSRTYIDRKSIPQIHDLGWISACSPSSPARRRPLNLNLLTNPPPRPSNSKKTFIYDHTLSMDPCNHPSHFYRHGSYLSLNTGPSPQPHLLPEFSSCASVIHHNIRIPNPYGWIDDIYPRTDDPEFDEKMDERLLWRGSNTGIYHAPHIKWLNMHRNHLVSYTNDMNGTIKILPPTLNEEEAVGEPREVRKARINPGMMDVGYAGNPIGCEPKETCQLLKKMFVWKEQQSLRDAGNYKYVFDVDGNGWSGRFKRLLTSNSLIFKSTIYPEWYTPRIAPWVHYIPIQLDLSDLHDTLTFFRGDADGDGAHEELAKKIAFAGRKWSKSFWRKEDMVAYYLRLMLEYARLMNVDRDAMTYRPPS
ncbi:hypothetical protein BDN72DRAFT_814608 [Pluteus cervinus]|uniref:Uncharacterized protein n=1 Tax=Pluteus cervinus TaxID=181527 RepID=A0ACD3B6Z2_9AGAR|nr:hypothetical protein BDN72DRAFT_814608 [Pluteus cervinus]